MEKRSIMNCSKNAPPSWLGIVPRSILRHIPTVYEEENAVYDAVALFLASRLYKAWLRRLHLLSILLLSRPTSFPVTTTTTAPPRLPIVHQHGSVFSYPRALLMLLCHDTVDLRTSLSQLSLHFLTWTYAWAGYRHPYRYRRGQRYRS